MNSINNINKFLVIESSFYAIRRPTMETVRLIMNEKQTCGHLSEDSVRSLNSLMKYEKKTGSLNQALFLRAS